MARRQSRPAVCRWWTVYGFIAWGLLAVSANAEPRETLADGIVGRIELKSYTPASQRPLITRSYLGDPPVVIHGELSLPATSALQRDGKFPVVILAHGTGGVSQEREHAWAKRFNSWGIAAFILDSYAGRGIKAPIYSTSPRFTHFAAHLLDAYRALQLLSTHPKIDASRIVLMGFSRGGEVAVNAVFERFRTGALDKAPHRFAAYIPLYPYCNFRYVGASLAAAPMLMLLGGADEMTDPKPCENYARWLTGAGIAVRVVVYPGAHHGFDRMGPVTFDPNYVGIRNCEAEYDVDSLQIRRLDTGVPLPTKEANEAWVLECRKTGGHVGGNAKAREAAVVEVRNFLTATFGR